MLGLRTQENDKFVKFFALVQKEADRLGSVFFLDCGQGKIFENNEMECEDLCGWLIPKEKAKEFECLFLENSSKLYEFDDFYTNVDYCVQNSEVVVIVAN